MTDPRKALVLFSGGQDSSVCLAWALERFAQVETVGFDYRQRHRVELDCRVTVLRELRAGFPQWADRLGEDHLIDAGVLAQLGDSALTRERAIEMQAGGLPNTFVPARNLLFLTLAAALAYRRGASVLVAGMCETDYSGYPDCRDNTLKAQQVALSLGLGTAMTIETPLMFIDKAADLGPGAAVRRRRADRPDHRAQPQLLPGRAQRAPPLGLGLRALSGLRAQAQRL